ncbi:MAG: hypothetical protein O2854_09560 [Chloroflexi bacterium]|nr:hypothetical protein [Chloroflexota bacterium]
MPIPGLQAPLDAASAGPDALSIVPEATEAASREGGVMLDQLTRTLTPPDRPSYEKGREAFHRGVGLRECPYSLGTTGREPNNYSAWRKGWVDALDHAAGNTEEKI